MYSGTDWAPKGNQDIRFEDVPKGKLNVLNGRKIRESYHERRKREAVEKAKKRSAPLASDAANSAGNRNEPPTKKAKRGTQGSKLPRSKASLPTTNPIGEGELHDGIDPSKLKIRPGESLRDFNRRVEDAYKFELSQTVRKVARAGRGEKRKARAKTLREEAEQELQGSNAEGEKRKANAQAAEAREKSEQKTLKTQREAMRRDTSGSGGQEERDFESAPLRKGVREVAEAPPTLKLGKLAALAKKQAAADTKQIQMEQERERAVQAYRLHKERKTLKRQG